MRVSPPSAATRSRCRSRNFASCSVAWTTKSVRSSAASLASSPSMSLRLTSMSIASLAVVLEVWPEPFPKEHRVVSFEDPFAGTVAERSRRLVRLELVEGRVVGQVEHDHVVEVPAVRDVEPANEADAELLLVFLDLAREQRLHEELEERVPAAADGEVRGEYRHCANGLLGALNSLGRGYSRMPDGADPWSSVGCSVGAVPSSSVAAWSSSSPTVGVALPSGRRRPSRRSADTSRSRKITVWPANSSRKIVRNRSPALIGVGHSHTTDSGVRMIATTSRTTWNRKQPSPGPRSESSGSPLYSIGRTVDSGSGVVTGLNVPPAAAHARQRARSRHPVIGRVVDSAWRAGHAEPSGVRGRLGRVIDAARSAGGLAVCPQVHVRRRHADVRQRNPDLAPVISPVMHGLRETEPQRRVEVPAVAVLDDLFVAVHRLREDIRPQLAVTSDDAMELVEARRGLLVEGRLLLDREEREVPHVGGDEVPQRLQDGAELRVRRRCQLLRRQVAKGLDQALRRPDVMVKRIAEQRSHLASLSRALTAASSDIPAR